MIPIMWPGISLFDGQKDRRFEPGETIFRAGAAVREVLLVRRGTTALVRALASGEQVILQRATDGDIVAEASIYTACYHCDCIALEPCLIAYMPRTSFRDLLRSDTDLSETWAAHLARGVQRARMLAEIRSLRTVAERLEAWMSEYGDIPEKGQWQTLAYELSVSREALYRELARRRSQ